MSDQRVFRVRRAPIIHDTIDDETIAINQLTGAYYSLEGASALAWRLLEDGATTAGMVAALSSRFDADPRALADAVAAFVKELLDEELIAEVDAPAATPGASADDGSQRLLPFPGLRLERYTDLEVMLLADPIHEVDETGWPTPLARSS